MTRLKELGIVIFTLVLYFVCGGWYVYGSIPEEAENDFS